MLEGVRFALNGGQKDDQKNLEELALKITKPCDNHEYSYLQFEYHEPNYKEEHSKVLIKYDNKGNITDAIIFTKDPLFDQTLYPKDLKKYDVIYHVDFRENKAYALDFDAKQKVFNTSKARKTLGSSELDNVKNFIIKSKCKDPNFNDKFNVLRENDAIQALKGYKTIFNFTKDQKLFYVTIITENKTETFSFEEGKNRLQEKIQEKIKKGEYSEHDLEQLRNIFKDKRFYKDLKRAILYFKNTSLLGKVKSDCLNIDNYKNKIQQSLSMSKVVERTGRLNPEMFFW